MQDTRKVLFAVVTALACAAPVQAQRTWIVAVQPGPGVDFTDIPPAVAAAGPGDRIEVLGTTTLTPTYSSFVVDKPLDIEALQAALVTSIRVENLAAGQVVRIAGFRVEPVPTWADPDNRLQVRDCDGTVLLTGLNVRNQTGDYQDGFVLRNAASVVLQDVESLGRNSGIIAGGAALVVDHSHCSAVRVWLRGGAGGSSISSAAGYDGGPGVVIQSGSLLAADSEITGGGGGTGFFYLGDGGDAVNVDPGSATLLRCSITPGLGPGQPGAAVDGVARVADDCVVVGALLNGAQTIPAVTMLQSSAAPQPGTMLDLTLSGEAGTFVLVGVDGRGELQFTPIFAEPLLLTSTWRPLAIGLLPAPDTTLSYPIPNLPELVGLQLWFQAAAFEAGGRATLTPVAVTRITL